MHGIADRSSLAKAIPAGNAKESDPVRVNKSDAKIRPDRRLGRRMCVVAEGSNCRVFEYLAVYILFLARRYGIFLATFTVAHEFPEVIKLASSLVVVLSGARVGNK